MRLLSNDKVVYEGPPCAYISLRGAHVLVENGMRGRVVSVNRGTAKVEFTMDIGPVDCFVPVSLLSLDVFHPKVSDPTRTVVSGIMKFLRGEGH